MGHGMVYVALGALGIGAFKSQASIEGFLIDWWHTLLQGLEWFFLLSVVCLEHRVTAYVSFYLYVYSYTISVCCIGHRVHFLSAWYLSHDLGRQDNNNMQRVQSILRFYQSSELQVIPCTHVWKLPSIGLYPHKREVDSHCCHSSTSERRASFVSYCEKCKEWLSVAEVTRLPVGVILHPFCCPPPPPRLKVNGSGMLSHDRCFDILCLQWGGLSVDWVCVTFRGLCMCVTGIQHILPPLVGCDVCFGWLMAIIHR